MRGTSSLRRTLGLLVKSSLRERPSPAGFAAFFSSVFPRRRAPGLVAPRHRRSLRMLLWLGVGDTGSGWEPHGGVAMFAKLRPSPAMVVAILALVVALGGTAFAGPIARMASTISGNTIEPR